MQDRSTRRRLSVEDRRAELLAACLRLIGERHWDEVTMADVAEAAGASKPLLYHYFATKAELYHATVQSAADELREATRLDPALPVEQRLRVALDAHLNWIDDHADAYRAILQGGVSSDAAVADIVEHSRAEVVERLAEAFELHDPTPGQRIMLRGWVGFLDAACLDWLEKRTISKTELADLLAASVRNLLGSGERR